MTPLPPLEFFKIVIMLIPAIIAIIGYSFRRRYAIRWVTLPPQAMLEFPKDISTRLKATFDKQPVKNLTKFRFVLHNSGSVAFDRKSIVTPVTWTGPGIVLDARVVNSQPYVKLNIQHSGQCVTLYWELFNQSCKALIEVLCDCSSGSGKGAVTAQIRDVPELILKDIYYVDEGEIRQSIKNNISRLPFISRVVLLRRLVEHIAVLNRFLIKLVLPVYVSIGAGLVILLFTLDLYPDWAAESAISSVLATLFIFYRYRNPYSKLLRSQSA